MKTFKEICMLIGMIFAFILVGAYGYVVGVKYGIATRPYDRHFWNAEIVVTDGNGNMFKDERPLIQCTSTYKDRQCRVMEVR